MNLFLGRILPFQIQTISSHVPNLTVVNTSNAAYHLKPHCSVYAQPEGGCKKEGLNFSRVDFVIEFRSGPDPFVDNDPFECPPGRSREVLGLLCGDKPESLFWLRRPGEEEVGPNVRRYAVQNDVSNSRKSHSSCLSRRIEVPSRLPTLLSTFNAGQSLHARQYTPWSRSDPGEI